MSKILAIDLGKFHSVTCVLDTETNATEFWTMSTDRLYLLTPRRCPRLRVWLDVSGVQMDSLFLNRAERGRKMRHQCTRAPCIEVVA